MWCSGHMLLSHFSVRTGQRSQKQTTKTPHYVYNNRMPISIYRQAWKDSIMKRSVHVICSLMPMHFNDSSAGKKKLLYAYRNLIPVCKGDSTLYQQNKLYVHTHVFIPGSVNTHIWPNLVPSLLSVIVLLVFDSFLNLSPPLIVNLPIKIAST